MAKEFNITGVCYPQQHYMMDNSRKLDRIAYLIEKGNYFTINRPRQYGKTTTLLLVEDRLIKTTEYLPIFINMQGIDSKWFKSDQAFASMFLQELSKALRSVDRNLHQFIYGKLSEVNDMNTLSSLISELCNQTEKKLVLFIDEVDYSSNYVAFLGFLGMLRTKYLNRYKAEHATFHSIILAGVHDIKSLKYKLGSPNETQYNSPWNIAIDFDEDMSFNPQEIAPMLQDYCQSEGKTMNIPDMADRLYYYTSGYPWLVSKLCKTIAEKIVPTNPQKNAWESVDIDQSVQILLKEVNTNFDGIIKNLENNPDLYQLVYRVMIEGESIPFNQYDPVIHKGMLYGLFKEHVNLSIHNQIYSQLIYSYMVSKTTTSLLQERNYRFDSHFEKEDSSLDMAMVLQRFQQFMKEQYSLKATSFLDREWRILFLAFLKPNINGKGHDFKEVETSDEKRLDVVVTYRQFKYIIELKKWRGDKAHQKGIVQLGAYLDAQQVTEGYLLIFDERKSTNWKEETIDFGGKKILAVWV